MSKSVVLAEAVTTRDITEELAEIHGAALRLAESLLFVDATADAIEREGREGVEALGWLQSILSVLAGTAQQLADRIEGFEKTVTRRA